MRNIRLSMTREEPSQTGRQRAGLRAATRIAVGTSAAAVAVAALAGGQANAAARGPAAAAGAARTVSASAAAAGYTAPRRTLQRGDRGADVTALQHRLWGMRYWLKITGVYDFDTQEAVYAFQAVNRLQIDGVVGPRTASALVRPHTYTPQDPAVASRVELNINAKIQVLVYYKNHQLTLISHISSAGGYRFTDQHGTQIATTPTGWYRANWFQPGWVTVPLGKMFNPVFFIGGAYAIHGDTDVPPTPASHGCVRIPDDLAQVFHTMISISSSSGTRIHIYNRASL
jgi:peptidoglycan hydrolase-like protein with peptidoglycan-binding domain